ncbi:hypothetical protein A3219_19325 [Salmonella enterica]|nr:hypothetical protein A3219_19325 [Salmonella enterica]
MARRYTITLTWSGNIFGTVVPGNDNFFAALNAAVAFRWDILSMFPKGVRCPMELSTYFRI